MKRNVVFALAFVSGLVPTFVTASVLVNAAGATFPYPLYSKWFDVFGKQNPDIQINYQALGSGAGIASIMQGTVDFGATDGPMTDEQLAAVPVPVLHFPTVLGAVVVTFNVKPHRPTAPRWGDTSWHLPREDHELEGPRDPASQLRPASRRIDYDGSPSGWQRNHLRPRGLPLEGEPGLAGDPWTRHERPLAAGTCWQRQPRGGRSREADTELHRLCGTRLLGPTRSSLRRSANRTGNFVLPSLGAVTAAAAAAEKIPDDFRVSITDCEEADGYPISSFTWLLIPARIADPQKGQALKTFLEWMLADGQSLATPLLYAPLPAKVVALEREAIAKIQVGK